MMRERLIRLIVIVIVAVLTAGVGNLVINRFQKNPQAFSSPLSPIGEKIEDFGEKVLGEMVKRLPNAPDLEKVALPTNAPAESEPIKQPVENIESQTQELIESIKKLPQDQLEAIKKQVFKEFCETILKN